MLGSVLVYFISFKLIDLNNIFYVILNYPLWKLIVLHNKKGCSVITGISFQLRTFSNRQFYYEVRYKIKLWNWINKKRASKCDNIIIYYINMIDNIIKKNLSFFGGQWLLLLVFSQLILVYLNVRQATKLFSHQHWTLT